MSELDNTSGLQNTSVSVTEEKERRELSPEERYYLASQWQLMWQKFRRHKVALIGGIVLIILYLSAIFADFVAPYPKEVRFEKFGFHPPTRVHLIDEEGNFSFGRTATTPVHCPCPGI